jgi:hypothetical protein
VTEHYDAGLSLISSEAMGKLADVPAFIVRHLGKGKAILLNFHLRHLNPPSKGDPADSVEEIRRELLKSLLGMAELKPMASLADTDGKPFTGDQALFRRGENVLLGFGKEGRYGRVADQEPYECKVMLAEPRFVYDVRRRKPLGQLSEFKVTALPSIAEMYGLLPYEVKKLSVMPQDEMKLGGLARFRLDLAASAPAGEHVFTVQVQDPTGRERREYAADLLAPDGKTEFQFPLALNDPPGEWKLTFRDVASGVTVGLSFHCVLDSATNANPKGNR